MISKSNLLIRIKAVEPLLNGKTRDGMKARYGPPFTKLRYALVLLVSIKVPNFEEHTKIFQNMTFVNLYRLGQIAELLGMDFQRSKTAEKIYRELEEKGEVRKIITDNNKIFVTITEEGEKLITEKLEYLELINERFYSRPSLQHSFVEKADEHGPTAKGSEPRGNSEEEIIVETLIKKISDWN